MEGEGNVRSSVLGHFKLTHLLTIPMQVARTWMEIQTWSSGVGWDWKDKFGSQQLAENISNLRPEYFKPETTKGGGVDGEDHGELQGFGDPRRVPTGSNVELPRRWPILDTKAHRSYFRSALGAVEWHGMRKQPAARASPGFSAHLKEHCSAVGT